VCIVIAGLDPAIHPLETSFVVTDARVKPAHDESGLPQCPYRFLDAVEDVLPR